ncbi:hypothetical protein EV126DRAFT_254383 [Verticillium dahliae]|nr:hypothetical protein EV126DRAFT_254383 [Verticillium dahliae]
MGTPAAATDEVLFFLSSTVVGTLAILVTSLQLRPLTKTTPSDSKAPIEAGASLQNEAASIELCPGASSQSERQAVAPGRFSARYTLPLRLDARDTAVIAPNRLVARGPNSSALALIYSTLLGIASSHTLFRMRRSRFCSARLDAADSRGIVESDLPSVSMEPTDHHAQGQLPTALPAARPRAASTFRHLPRRISRSSLSLIISGSSYPRWSCLRLFCSHVEKTLLGLFLLLEDHATHHRLMLVTGSSLPGARVRCAHAEPWPRLPLRARPCFSRLFLSSRRELSTPTPLCPSD